MNLTEMVSSTQATPRGPPSGYVFYPMRQLMANCSGMRQDSSSQPVRDFHGNHRLKCIKASGKVDTTSAKQLSVGGFLNESYWHCPAH